MQHQIKKLVAIFTFISLALSAGGSDPNEKPIKGKPVINASKIENMKKRGEDYIKNILPANVKADCKVNVLRYFGITGDLDKPMVASSSEKAYCAKNELTCCTDENFKSIQETFAKAVRELQRRTEMIEELLTLFRGPAFIDPIRKFLNEDEIKCDYIFESPKKRSEFVNKSFLEEQADQLQSLAVDLEMYFKDNKWFHGDFVCSICDPINHEFIKFEEGKADFQIHFSVCERVYSMKEFELRVAKAYNEFINPYINLLKCSSTKKEDEKESSVHTDEGVDENEELMGKKKHALNIKQASVHANLIEENDVEDKKVELIEKIPIDKVNTNEKQIQKCYGRGLYNYEKNCNTECSKDILAYKSSFEFYDKIAQALKIVFEHLTEKNETTIEQFYLTSKNTKFIKTNNDVEISFFNVEKETENNLKIIWNINKDKGIAIFSNPISKKFSQFKPQSVTPFIRFKNWLGFK